MNSIFAPRHIVCSERCASRSDPASALAHAVGTFEEAIASRKRNNKHVVAMVLEGVDSLILDLSAPRMPVLAFDARPGNTMCYVVLRLVFWLSDLSLCSRPRPSKITSLHLAKLRSMGCTTRLASSIKASSCTRGSSLRQRSNELIAVERDVAFSG